MLVRSTQLRTLVSEIGTRFNKRVLTGPSGAGKSLLLYLCTLDCHVRGNWLVLYIANSSEFNNYEGDMCARQILRSFVELNKCVFLTFHDKQYVQMIKDTATKAIDNILNERMLPKKHLL